MLKTFFAKYVIELLIGVIVVLAVWSAGLYYKYSTTSLKLDKALEEIKTVKAEKKTVITERDIALSDNKNWADVSKRQNESIEQFKRDAKERNEKIATLQHEAKQQVAPHKSEAKAILAMKTGGNECEALSSLVDAIKP